MHSKKLQNGIKSNLLLQFSCLYSNNCVKLTRVALNETVINLHIITDDEGTTAFCQPVRLECI